VHDSCAGVIADPDVDLVAGLDAHLARGGITVILRELLWCTSCR
jgi:hypothetical protein